MADLTAAHGGTLIDLLVDDERAAELAVEARDLVSWDLNDRQLHDLELLMSGAFSPLTGFMTRTDYEPVVGDMRLGAGALWPIPVTLDARAGQLAEDHALRGYDAFHLAAVELLADGDLVVVAGDQDLKSAAHDLGLATANLD